MQRNKAVDAVKGVAILLVMLGHCIVLNGLNETDPYIYDVIKSVQMPLFMLVSGVLASYSLHKYRQDKWYGIKKLPKRVVSYLLPFTSWFVVVYVWTHAWEAAISLQSFLTEGKELLFQTDKGLWFLTTLFVIQLMVTLAQTLAVLLTAGKKVPEALVFAFSSFALYVLLFTEQKRQYISEPFFDGAVFSVFLSGIFRTWLSGDRGTYRADRAAQTILRRDCRCALNCTVSLAGDHTGSDKTGRRCDDSASANAGIFIGDGCYLFHRDCMGRKKRKAATGKTGGCFTAELSGTIHTGNLCDPFPLRKNSEIIKS